MKLFKKAILIVHGFAGGVYDEEYLNHRLELHSNYDVFTFTLPGHDGDDKYTMCKYQDWIKKAESEIEFLIKNGYNSIYVIGHSMGGVIATYLAANYREVKKLVLAAPAFRFVGFEDGDFSPISAFKDGSKILEQYGARLLTSRFTKMPRNAILEFMKLVNKYQDVGIDVEIPTLILYGTNDHVVPRQAIDHVYHQLSTKDKKIVLLKNITHDIFRENKKEESTLLIEEFFKSTSSLKFMPSEITRDWLR